MSSQASRYQEMYDSFVGRRVEELQLLVHHFNGNIPVLSSRIYLGRFKLDGNLESLHPSVRKIVKGVRDGRLAQPMREVRYAPSEQRTIKPNPRYEKTIEMLEEFQEKEAEAMRKAHEKDVFYPKLGIFLGSVNVESVQEGSVFSDSFSSDSQDREFYYVPGQRNYIAFLRRISCRSWGFVGLMPSEICQGFEEVNPKVVVQSIDVLKAAREMAKYLSLGDREKAHHSYHAFLQDHNSPTDDFGLIKPAGFRFRLSWV